jgi:hypothetical protein
MDNTVQLKIEFESSLRRASIGRTESLQNLKRTIQSLIGIANFDVKYRDEENDLITIGSDEELHDMLENSLRIGRVLRVIIFPREAAVDAEVVDDKEEVKAEAPKAESAFPQEQIPLIALARALANPSIVERIQEVLQSPVITETINRVAQAYVDSEGDLLIAGLVASQHIQALLAVLAELLEEFPVLKEVQTLLMGFIGNPANWMSFFGRRAGEPQQGFGFGGPTFGRRPPFPPAGNPWTGNPWGAFPTASPAGVDHPHSPHGHHGPHPFGPHPGHHGHPGHHEHGHHGHHEHHEHGHHGPEREKHPGVFCDGCGSDEALKRAAIEAGFQTRRGFIAGMRYKSSAVDDFDLCQNCKETNRFPEAVYGPFKVVAGVTGGKRGGRGGGCRGPWWRSRAANEQNNWRNRADEGAGEKRTQEEAFADEGSGKQTKFDFMEAIRNVFAHEGAAAPGGGANAQPNFVEVMRSAFTQGAAANQGNEFGELARAISESLKPSAGNASPQSKESEWVPVAKPVDPSAAEASNDPFAKWASQLSQLETLGFENAETYINILEEEKGDLDRVVNRIMRRDA